jgi:GNAT superfamily N-acetyltransferase
MTTSIAQITLLADRPDLAAAWAELHWREWGIGGTNPERKLLAWWVADATQAVHRTHVPIAVLALGPGGVVLGGVGMHEFDLEERRDRSPWIVGMIVRPERRGEGIGQALIASLETWAAAMGTPQVWVATETASRAVAFYQRCGYTRLEDLPAQRGEMVTVLTKRLPCTHP